MIGRAKKLFGILRQPRLWRALSMGVAPTIEHGAALTGRQFKTVIDVGANKGQFATFAAATWPAAQIICFEPLPGPRNRLEQLLKVYAPNRSVLHGMACSTSEGVATMHVASREDSSSLLPLADAQKQMFAMEETAQVTVPIRRLDQVIGSEIARPALLKLDVQGFEHEVLEGATDLLPNLDAIYVEASFVELYEGQRLAVDVTALLSSAGFVLDRQYNTQHTATGEAVQADLLFKRTAT